MLICKSCSQRLQQAVQFKFVINLHNTHYFDSFKQRCPHCTKIFETVPGLRQHLNFCGNKSSSPDTASKPSLEGAASEDSRDGVTLKRKIAYTHRVSVPNFQVSGPGSEISSTSLD